MIFLSLWNTTISSRTITNDTLRDSSLTSSTFTCFSLWNIEMFQEVNFNLENKNMAVALAPTSFNKLQLRVKKNTPCLFIKMVTFSLPFYTELGMKCFKRSCIV